MVLSEMRDDESSVYLIPEMDFGPEDWLRKNYLAIFEEELHAWHTDETVRVKQRWDTLWVSNGDGTPAGRFQGI